MNHARRHRHGTMISCLAFVALAGCAEYKAENPALTEYPGIQSQIENFYDANATEDDWICDSPQMNTIDKSQVVSQSATQVRIAVTYYFQSSVLSPQTGRQPVPGLQHPLLHLRQGSRRPAEPGVDVRSSTGTKRMTRLAKTSTRATGPRRQRHRQAAGRLLRRAGVDAVNRSATAHSPPESSTWRPRQLMDSVAHADG